MSTPTKIKCKVAGCPCRNHSPPHCKCRLLHPARKPIPAKPTDPRPGSGQLIDWLTLLQIAWMMARMLGVPIFTRQISGAIQSLGLKFDNKVYEARVRGSVHFRQMTQVHKKNLPAIQAYMKGRLTP